MNEIDLLRQVIANHLHFKLKDNVLTIKETAEDATCRWVDIKLKNSLPTFAFSIDIQREKNHLDPIYPFFNPEITDLTLKNDAIIFVQKSGQLIAFLIELKSHNKGKYLKQLLAVKLLVQFMLKRIELSESALDNQLFKNVAWRGILFCCRRIPNEGTTKHTRIEYESRHRDLSVAELDCHTLYHIQSFM